MGDSRAEGSSTIGDGGQATTPVKPDMTGYANTHSNL